MLLKSLELQGFKSFAKRTVLSFEPGITAVVGPNGSGKSNIADAIRWVLGAQSKKAIRGKIRTDVIFSGTNARSAMGLAEVSLNFDNSDHKLPFDYDEVTVTRRLYRSGDSEYLVNGGQVRLGDLQHAFAVAGIGAENYTVIGQGMVDRVLSQSAKERLGLFEEAAGVRQFKLKRDEARRKLTETTTNLSRVEDIVKKLAPRLKLLRRQASALEQRAEIEQALTDAYRARFGHRYRGIFGAFKEAKQKQTEMNQELLASEREQQELKTKVDTMRRSHQGLTLNKLLSDRNQKRDELEKLRGATLDQSTARRVAEATIGRVQSQLTENQRRLKALEPVKLETSQQAEERLANSRDIATAIDQLEQSIFGKKPYDELARQVAGLKQLVDSVRGRRAAEVAKERELLEEQQRELTAEQQKLQSQIASKADPEAESTIKTLETELAGLEKKIGAEQQSALGETKELDKAEAQLSAKHRTYEDYRRALADLNVELAKLETRLENLKQEATAKLGEKFPPADDEALPPAESGDDQHLAKLEKKMLELGGIAPEVAEEFQEVEQRHTFLTGQGEDLRQAKADLEKLIRQLERQSQTIFKEAFAKINDEFGAYFEKLFGGGNAELKLVESKREDEEAESDEPRAADLGIEIKALPPGKRLQNLSQLSGGERALTSVALLFAILTVNPSPFVMLDEVDAALDEANTARFAELLQELSKQTQFVVVTHNRDTMRAAEMLYGITMDETGISTLLSIKLPEAEKVAGVA